MCPSFGRQVMDVRFQVAECGLLQSGVSSHCYAPQERFKARRG